MSLFFTHAVFFGGAANVLAHAANNVLRLSGSPPAGVVGSAFSFTPAVAGGTAPYSYALSGTLPGGLSFNTATGAITGTPA